jgi:hypothetical protein
MENNNKFRITLTGWKAYAVAGIAGVVVSLAIFGAGVLGHKVVESFE